MSKGIVLTPRDKKLFEDLYDLVFLDLDYIQKVIYKKEDGSVAAKQVVTRRLRALEQHEYISSDRLALLDKAKAGKSKNVYTIAQRGLEEVREIFGEAKWDTRWTDRTPSHIYHCLELADVYASFQLTPNKDFEIYDWLNESRSHYRFAEGRDGSIRPDGLMLLKRRNKEAYAAFMMEIERSKQRKEVSIGKLKRYNQYCKDKCFQNQDTIDVPILPPRVVFISARENEMRNLMLHTREVDTKAINGVLYTTMEKLKADPWGKIFLAKGSAVQDRLYGIFEPIEKEQ